MYDSQEGWIDKGQIVAYLHHPQRYGFEIQAAKVLAISYKYERCSIKLLKDHRILDVPLREPYFLKIYGKGVPSDCGHVDAVGQPIQVGDGVCTMAPVEHGVICRGFVYLGEIVRLTKELAYVKKLAKKGILSGKEYTEFMEQKPRKRRKSVIVKVPYKWAYDSIYLSKTGATTMKYLATRRWYAEEVEDAQGSIYTDYLNYGTLYKARPPKLNAEYHKAYKKKYCYVAIAHTLNSEDEEKVLVRKEDIEVIEKEYDDYMYP